MSKQWHTEGASNVLDFFNVKIDRGLSADQAIRQRKRYGENILSEEKARSLFDIFITQFKSPLIYVLVIATLIVFILGDFIEASIILFIIILNAIIGTFQEGKAQNTLAALNKVVKSYTTVIRDGEEMRIPDYELVPGDIIYLKDGEVIGADARIVESNSLKVNESSLTGESSVVIKSARPISMDGVSTADQTNMVFRGTYVVSGLAQAVVVHTGTSTVIGGISKRLVGLNEGVPLKKNIDNLSRLLVGIVIAASATIFIIGIYTGHSGEEMFTTVVAVAVSAIPESLPVVVTLVLATGVWRMSKQKVLVKKLQAVEALGQAKVIALDKTGTITKNQMAVEKIFVDGQILNVSGGGYDPTGEITTETGEVVDPGVNKGLDYVLKISAFTAIADIEQNKKDGEWLLEYGDPTEAALLVLAKKAGYEKEELLKEFPRIQEMPFDNKNKHHSTVNKVGDHNVLFTAGGPEVILEKCDSILHNGRSKKITEADRSILDQNLTNLSKEGYRILALAIKTKAADVVHADDLPGLTFIGFVGIIDTIRPEVESAVESVRQAGMHVAMITGDFVETAKAIASKVKIYQSGDKILTGVELSEMTDEQLDGSMESVTVFARVTPDDKMRIIEAYKRRGETVAMTGDGVNDALSLVAADLGVSMGKMGTEVAREASDIVLLDDNFGNIVHAAEEGRNIYWTVRKSIVYLLATNLGELLVIMVAIISQMPLPLLATQIIWLNFITDTFLVAALALEPKEKGLMNVPFSKPTKYIVDWKMGLRIGLVGLVMTVFTLFLFTHYLDFGIVKAWTISLTMLTVFQWYNIFNVRFNNETVFSKKSFSNKYILVGLFAAASLHIFAVYNPFMQKVLNITSLNAIDWVIVLVVGLSVIVVEEVRKLIVRKSGRYLIKKTSVA